MPFKSKAQQLERQCKHCQAAARQNIRPDGRNKGYYRTCGAAECLSAQYHDKAVNARKHFRKEIVCEFCEKTVWATSPRQRWCKVCIPDKKWRAIAQRYGINKASWEEILASQHGTCALCSNEPKCIDHDHESNRIRGLLCYSCNLLLAGIDADTTWINRARDYIKKGRD